MNRPALALLALVAPTLAHGEPVAQRGQVLGDRIDRRLDLRGDRLERRTDRIGHHHAFRRG